MRAWHKARCSAKPPQAPAPTAAQFHHRCPAQGRGNHKYSWHGCVGTLDGCFKPLGAVQRALQGLLPPRPEGLPR